MSRRCRRSSGAGGRPRDPARGGAPVLGPGGRLDGALHGRVGGALRPRGSLGWRLRGGAGHAASPTGSRRRRGRAGVSRAGSDPDRRGAAGGWPVARSLEPDPEYSATRRCPRSGGAPRTRDSRERRRGCSRSGASRERRKRPVAVSRAAELVRGTPGDGRSPWAWARSAAGTRQPSRRSGRSTCCPTIRRRPTSGPWFKSESGSPGRASPRPGRDRPRATGTVRPPTTKVVRRRAVR